jgi:malate synthase
MQLIAAQADTDYAQGALAYANKYGTDFSSGKGPYSRLSNFDLQWQQQRNPQVYAAAMGALNGQKNWWQGLSDTPGPNGAPSEYQRALEVVSRASPSARVIDKSGNTISMDPNTRTQPKPPPGFTVVQ